jgi:hypothetical protein
MNHLVMPPRAIVAAAAFALAGLAGFLLAPHPWLFKLPHALFYAVLVLNTFFSIRFFDALPPQDRDERAIDAVLTVLYLVLAATIGWLVPFAFVATLLFAAATLKYVLLLPVMERHDILAPKIFIDGLGLAMCVAMLIGSLLFDPLWTAWTAAVAFALANVYLLAIRPMYADPRAALALPETTEARQAAPLKR